MNVKLIPPPYSDRFIENLTRLCEAIFGKEASSEWLAAIKWRLHNMPDVTVFGIEEGNELVAFKAGYASSYHSYYSWLGGVHPKWRRRGMAARLMKAQHDWLESSRFKTCETKVAQNNLAMIALNLHSQMNTIGTYSKSGEPYLIMERVFK